ncbi:MAG: tetratricopeptide repeat protein, partial [Planctomycetaceae bacterium]
MRSSNSRSSNGILITALVSAMVFAAPVLAQESATQPADDIHANIRRIWLTSVEPLPDKASNLPELSKALANMTITPRTEMAAIETVTTAPATSQPTSNPHIVEMSPEALEKIKVLAASKSADHAKLADDFYSAGHLTAAGILYEAALKSDSPADKDWLLFQSGNCLCDSNQPAAMEAYRKLVAEFPNSPWTPLAVTKMRLM